MPVTQTGVMQVLHSETSDPVFFISWLVEHYVLLRRHSSCEWQPDEALRS